MSEARIVREFVPAVLRRAGRAARIQGGRGALLVLVLLLAVGGLVGGCGRNQGAVPTEYVPEGQVAQDGLLLTSLALDPETGTSYVQLVIATRSRASGWSVYRRTEGSGFDKLNDPAKFEGTYNQGFEIFTATDLDWRGDRAADYLARGVVGGLESGVSPETGTVTFPAGDTLALLPQASIELICPKERLVPDPEVPGDSVVDRDTTDWEPSFAWGGVAEASFYVLELVRADGHLFGLAVLEKDGSLRTLLHGNALTRSRYAWVVYAYDAQWRLVAFSPDVGVFDVFPERARACPPDAPASPLSPRFQASKELWRDAAPASETGGGNVPDPARIFLGRR